LQDLAWHILPPSVLADFQLISVVILDPKLWPVYPLVKYTRSENFAAFFTYLRKNDFSICSIPAATHLLQGMVKKTARLTCFSEYTGLGEQQQQG